MKNLWLLPVAILLVLLDVALGYTLGRKALGVAVPAFGLLDVAHQALHQPANCRELAEYLEKRGLPCTWRSRSPNSIWIVQKGTLAETNLLYTVDHDPTGFGIDGWAVITEHESAAAADKSLGTIPKENGFRHGRFTITGQPDWVQTIKDAITP
jgi:hypothetical protein